MDRLEFIRKCGIAACTLPVAGAIILEGCKSTASLSYETAGNKLLIKKTDLETKPYAILRTVLLPAPLLVSKNTDGTYAAVLMKCSHKGCELKTEISKLTCPCHGAEFTFGGKVLSKPATKDLILYPVTIEEQQISIQL